MMKSQFLHVKFITIRKIQWTIVIWILLKMSMLSLNFTKPQKFAAPSSCYGILQNSCMLLLFGAH